MTAADCPKRKPAFVRFSPLEVGSPRLSNDSSASEPLTFTGCEINRHGSAVFQGERIDFDRRSRRRAPIVRCWEPVSVVANFQTRRLCDQGRAQKLFHSLARRLAADDHSGIFTRIGDAPIS